MLDLNGLIANLILKICHENGITFWREGYDKGGSAPTRPYKSIFRGGLGDDPPLEMGL